MGSYGVVNATYKCRMSFAIGCRARNILISSDYQILLVTVRDWTRC